MLVGVADVGAELLVERLGGGPYPKLVMEERAGVAQGERLDAVKGRRRRAVAGAQPRGRMAPHPHRVHKRPVTVKDRPRQLHRFPLFPAALLAGGPRGTDMMIYARPQNLALVEARVG